MTKDNAYLYDILESAKLALEHMGNVPRDEFEKDILLQDAVVRRLEIIGEATRRISTETKQRYPLLPWKDMLGMRNAAIHEYDDLDLKLIWDTVVRDLPTLIKELEQIIPPE
jgi:uncharacterized protein with HEPN domain